MMMSFNRKAFWRGFFEGLAMPAVGAVWAFNRVTGRDALLDRIDGLEADLDSAVEVAWNRGATEWVRLNYPSHYAKFTYRDWSIVQVLGEDPPTVKLHVQRRTDGGLRVWSDDVRGLILSHSDPKKVMEDVLPALDVLWPAKPSTG